MAIDTELHGTTLVVRINRPEALNALDVDDMRTLHDTLRAFRDDASLRVGVLTGSGQRAFCAGADLKRTLPPATTFAESYFAPYDRSVDDGLYVRAITVSELNLTKPLIAAVNGHALGAGLELALDCHLRIASEHATFGLPEPRWASVPAVGGVSKLLRAIPRALALRMILTGDRIDAVEAHRVGLVSDLVPPDDLLEAALALADRIASCGPLAIHSLITLTTRSDDLPLSQSIAMEQLLWGVLRDTHDRVEGRSAFAERRQPRYAGR
jgi:E-phenylitaconyl-CoA hydratase